MGVLSGDIHLAGGMPVHQLSVLIVIANGMPLLHVSKPARHAATSPGAPALVAAPPAGRDPSRITTRRGMRHTVRGEQAIIAEAVNTV